MLASSEVGYCDSRYLLVCIALLAHMHRYSTFKTVPKLDGAGLCCSC